MKDVPEMVEVTKLKKRIRRLYGAGRLTIVQHNVGMRLVGALVHITEDPDYARLVDTTTEKLFNGYHDEN
jgi:hypothetical protein